MNVTEFSSQYISEQPLLWLFLAVLVGLFVGVRFGRRIERARGGSKKSRVEVPVSVAESIGHEVSGAGASADAPPITPVAADTDGDTLGRLVGITDKQIKTLSAHGIASIDQLRAATTTKTARENLADELQLEDFVVNKWARMADFLSLDDMTPEVAEFLVFAGINSTRDLASRNAESVTHKLHNLNEKEARIDTVPTRQQLEAWVASLNA